MPGKMKSFLMTLTLFVVLAAFTGGCFVSRSTYKSRLAEVQDRLMKVKARNRTLEEELRALRLKYDERGRALKEITDRYIERSELDKKLRAIEKGLRDALKDTRELETYIEGTLQTGGSPVDDATVEEWLARTRDVRRRIEEVLEGMD